MSGREIVIVVVVFVAVIAVSVPILSLVTAEPESGVAQENGVQTSPSSAKEKTTSARKKGPPTGKTDTAITKEGPPPTIDLPIAKPGQTPYSVTSGHKVVTKKFLVRFPNKPTQTRRQKRGNITLQLWKGQYQDLRFGLSTYDIADPGEYMNARWRARLKSAKKNNSQIIYNSRIKRNGYSGRFVAIQKQDGSELDYQAWYLVGKRMYSMSASGPPTQVKSDRGRLLFISFLVVNE